jgi:hypothetical protein
MPNPPPLAPCTICNELRPPIYYKDRGPFCLKHWVEARQADRLNPGSNAPQEGG